MYKVLNCILSLIFSFSIFQEIKAQPGKIHSQIDFNIEELSLIDSVTANNILESLSFNYQYYKTLQTQKKQFRLERHIIKKGIDPRKPIEFTGSRPQLEIAFNEDSTYRCFRIYMFDEHWKCDRFVFELKFKDKVTTIELKGNWWAEDAYLGNISFSKALHEINLTNPTYYKDIYFRSIMDPLQENEEDRIFKPYVSPYNPANSHGFSNAKRKRIRKRVARNKKKDQGPIDFYDSLNRTFANLGRPFNSADIKRYSDAVAAEDRRRDSIEEAQKPEILKKEGDGYANSFSFILKDYPLYGNQFNQMSLIDSFQVSYQLFWDNKPITSIKAPKLEYYKLNDSLRRCFRLDVEGNHLYKQVVIQLKDSKNRDFKLDLPINVRTDKHYYLGELDFNEKDKVFSFDNPWGEESTNRILIEPIRIPEEWIPPPTPPAPKKPQYYVYYSDGKGDIDATVFFGKDALGVIPTQNEKLSKYYFKTGKHTPSSRYGSEGFDLTIIHPDYQNFEHRNKKMHNQVYFLSNGKDTTYSKYGLSRWLQWDKKTICLTVKVDYSNNLYGRMYKDRKVKDSVDRSTRALIDSFCKKYGLRKKPDFIPAKQYFYSDFDLTHVFLLQRIDGKNFNKSAHWLPELRKHPRVQSVSMPTSVGTENELEGPHISNKFKVQFQLGTSKERIKEIMQACRILEYRQDGTDYYSAMHNYTCKGKQNEFLPRISTIKLLLSFDEVLKVESIYDHYYDMRG